MTTYRFAVVLIAMAFTGSAVLWIAAFNLSGRTGRLVLTAGLYLVFEARRGRHELRDETPTYDGDPVHLRDHRSEEERAADYANMRAETQALPLTISAAPYMAWTGELHPTDLDELRYRLERVQAEFAARVDAVLNEFLREHTDEQALVAA